ncbi:hypothetical protein GCM10010306_100490 [Streptomyces umbrinus]|nr:hypothetical protein GCM10010306_100490 [Streptomyces umbrinus]
MVGGSAPLSGPPETSAGPRRVQLLPGLPLTPLRFRDLVRDLRHAQPLALPPDRNPGHIVSTPHHALPSCGFVRGSGLWSNSCDP